METKGITTITEFHRTVREMTGNEYLTTVRASSEDDGHIKYEAYTNKTSWISGVTPEGVVEHVRKMYQMDIPPMDMVILPPPLRSDGPEVTLSGAGLDYLNEPTSDHEETLAFLDTISTNKEEKQTTNTDDLPF